MFDSGDDESNPNETPDRRIKYDRDFLLNIGQQLHARKVPGPDLFPDVVRDSGSNQIRSHHAQRMKGSPGPRDQYNRGARAGPQGMKPGLMMGNYGPRGNHGGVMMQCGMGGPHMPPAKVKKEEVKLHKAENAWKPGIIKQRIGTADRSDDPEEAIADDIVKRTRSILNKLTPENSDKLTEKFMFLPLEDKEERIGKVIKVVFEKAVVEPSFSKEYAKMVHKVCNASQETSIKFRKQILDQCQQEFQSTNTDNDKIEILEDQLAEATEDDRKKELEAELEESKFQARKRSLGNVKFIGELFKFQMLTPKIMVECVGMLLISNDEESLECLCILLTIIGQKLETELSFLEDRIRTIKSQPKDTQKLPKFIPEDNWMAKTFNQLKNLSDNKKFSSKIRFELLDVVELRDNSWKPRRDLNAPKMFDKVCRDAIRQEMGRMRQIKILPPSSMGDRKVGPISRQEIPPGPQQAIKRRDWITVLSNKSRFQPIPKKPEQSVPVVDLSISWTSSPESLAQKMIPVLKNILIHEEDKIRQVLKEKSWDVREELTSKGLIEAICSLTWNADSGIWDIKALQKLLPLLPLPNTILFPPIWKQASKFMARRNIDKAQTEELWGVMYSLNLATAPEPTNPEYSDDDRLNSNNQQPPSGYRDQMPPQSQQKYQKIIPVFKGTSSRKNSRPIYPKKSSFKANEFCLADPYETVKNIFEEYDTIGKLDDTLHWIQQRFPGKKISEFVDELAHRVGDMAKIVMRQKAGTLTRALITANLISKKIVLKTLAAGVISELADILIDAPMAVNYVAQYLIEIFYDEPNLDWLISVGEPLIESEENVFFPTWEELVVKTLNLLKSKANEDVVQNLFAKTNGKIHIATENIPWIQKKGISCPFLEIKAAAKVLENFIVYDTNVHQSVFYIPLYFNADAVPKFRSPDQLKIREIIKLNIYYLSRISNDFDNLVAECVHFGIINSDDRDEILRPDYPLEKSVTLFSKIITILLGDGNLFPSFLIVLRETKNEKIAEILETNLEFEATNGQDKSDLRDIMIEMQKETAYRSNPNSTEEEKDKWNCSRCTYENEGGTSCDMCFRAKNN